MKFSPVSILVGIGIAALLVGSGFLAGRKTCPKAIRPIPSAQIPETKPAQTKEELPPKQVIRWRKVPVVDVAKLSDAEQRGYVLGRQEGWREGWDSCALAHHAYFRPERFTVTDTTPHTKDSISFWPLADTFSVVHMGIIPTVLAGGEQESRRRRTNLLRIGLNWWFNQPAELWGTIPLPRERRMFYFPHRAGAAYQPQGKDWRLVVEWGLL